MSDKRITGHEAWQTSKERLRYLRIFQHPDNHGLAARLAREAGVSGPTVSLWLNGKDSSRPLRARTRLFLEQLGLIKPKSIRSSMNKPSSVTLPASPQA